MSKVPTEQQQQQQGSGNHDGNAAATSSDSPSFSLDDVQELVQAIKFAYPDYGIRRVHREIVEVASDRGNEPALKAVKLGEVKKIWKKLNLGNNNNNNNNNVANAGNAAANNDNNNNDGGTVASDHSLNDCLSTNTSNSNNSNNNNDTILKFYTVGDGSVKSLAHGYKAAALAAEAESKQNEPAAATAAADNGRWFHFFLDVPADQSGERPHQALINFSDNHHNGGGSRAERRQAKRSANNNNNNNNTTTNTTTDQEHEVVKIQVAAGADGTKHPMLLYNANRSARTFLHPDHDDAGYDAIRDLIVHQGATGALGDTGGTKGFFRCHLLRAKNVVSVDASSLLSAGEHTW